MKLLFLLFATINIYGQVGIGTTDPQSTLHIADSDTLTHGLTIEKVPLSNSRYVLVIEPDGKVGKRLIHLPGHLKTTDTIENPRAIFVKHSPEDNGL